MASPADKWEHRTDGIHDTWRLERQARPAGQDAQVFQADLDLDAEDDKAEVAR